MSLRITGGRLRGRVLGSPADLAVRPTTSRVREALFSILGQALPGLRVLDLFAGAGTLGIEAASRGARLVVFVERDSGPLRLLRSNAEVLRGHSEVSVVAGDVLEALPRLAQEGHTFDLVFLDAPYGKGLGAAALAALEQHPSLLQAAARVVCEAGSTDELPTSVAGLRGRTPRSYGDTRLHLYEGIPAP